MKVLWTAVIVLCLGANLAQATQSCPHEGPRSAPDSRYVNNGNGTISDSQTGLMWKQCSEGQAGATCDGPARRLNWEQALEVSEDASFADFDDWRLPTVDELEGLVETTCVNPSINVSSFANTWSGGYWTSTEYPADDDYVWYVDFLKGKRSFNGRSSYYGVRLVRDKQ